MWSITDNFISKYQFMELNTQRRTAGLKDKLPEMQKTLDTVRFLKIQPVHDSSRVSDGRII